MAESRRLLAIDTATGACSVAVAEGGRISARIHQEMRRGHSELLIGMIESVMRDSNLDYSDLDAILVTRGPGAFTGLRIGLSTARAIGLASGKPVFGLTTLEVIAAGVQRGLVSPARVLAAVDGRRAEPYAQMFGADGKAISGIIAATTETVADLKAEPPCILAGDGCGKLLPLLPVQPSQRFDMSPDAAELALLADRLMQAGAVLSPADPLYIRPPDAVTQADAEAARRAKNAS